MLDRSLPFVALMSLGIVVGCAEGSGLDGAGGDGGAGGAITGVGSTSGVTSGPSTSSASSSSSSSSSSASSSASTGTGMMCNYDAVETCATAEPLPAIAGDENGATIMRSGSTSKWYKIHIEEQNSSVFGEDLSYRVSLTSPPGMNYDLRVHEGPQNGNPNCNAPAKVGAGSPTETVQASWNDDQGFGGEDDSLWLNIEVLYVSGSACGPGNEWTLSVVGHI